MKLEELKNIIKWEVDRLNKVYSGTTRELLFWATLKLTEENGEVAEQVLASMGFQRKHKVVDFTKEKLEHELADMILVTMILAERFDIDIEKAIEGKLEIIRKRVYKEHGVKTLF